MSGRKCIATGRFIEALVDESGGQKKIQSEPGGQAQQAQRFFRI